MLLRCLPLFLMVCHAYGFASWMTTDYCSRSLVVGQIIMNEEVTQSDDRVIEVYRGNEQLQSGASYTPGEALTVKISDAQKEYVFEAWGGATFTGGGCAGRRIANKPSAEIVMPTALPEEGQVKIAAAWAPGHVAVLLSRDFVLMPPSDPANLPANPPSNPPDHADPDETHKEEPVHDLLSDLQASIAQQEAQRLQQEREESARRELNKLAEETQEEEGAVAKPEGAQPLEQAEGSARSAAEKAAAAISAVRTVVHEKKAERKHWKMGEEELLAPPNTWRVKQQGQRQEGQPEEPVYRDILGEELERNRVGLRGGQELTRKYRIDKQGRKVLTDDDAQLSEYAKQKRASPQVQQRRQRRQQVKAMHRYRQLGIIVGVIVVLVLLFFCCDCVMRNRFKWIKYWRSARGETHSGDE